jgi:hypothetical protein
VFPAPDVGEGITPGAGEGITPGPLTGVGPDNERNTGPSSGEGDGLTAASGEGPGLAAASGSFAGFSVPGVVSAVGDVAGRTTTRGVAEAPGDGTFSAGAGEGSLFSSS